MLKYDNLYGKDYVRLFNKTLNTRNVTYYIDFPLAELLAILRKPKHAQFMTETTSDI